jgi:hypothetical protein
MITLKTLPQATAQEVFDQVARHLLTQNEKAYASNDGGKCFYRLGMLKCAAGCLIADNEYRQQFETLGEWRNLVDDGLVPDTHEGLISHLQNVHDYYAPVEWREALRGFAKYNELSAEVLDG